MPVLMRHRHLRPRLTRRRHRPSGLSDPSRSARRNWLFAGADAGGETLADAMTLIETAQLAGLNPEPTSPIFFARINDLIITRLDELPPWDWRP